MRTKWRLFWVLGLLVAGLSPNAIAEELVFTFEARLQRVVIQPPEGSLAAQAAQTDSITGRFEFSSSAPVAATAGIPGRVEFASYDTGFISINELDTSGLAGSPEIRISNGITQAEDPKSTIKDEMLFSYRAVSEKEPIDSLALRFSYRDANALRNVGLPTTLDIDDFDSASLSFSSRIDSIGNRAQGDAGTPQVLGLVHFNITAIEHKE